MGAIERPQDLADHVPAFLRSGGDMGLRIARFPWAGHALGEPANWPQSLKTSVSLILNSQHPMWIGWSSSMWFLYNDAYISVLGAEKDRWALGRPASAVWPEIWDICGPLADKVFREGEATFIDETRLFMSRGEAIEETYYSFSYSPIRDESGGVGGLFCPSNDVTAKVLGARRLRTLSELAANALAQTSVTAACLSAMATLEKNADDVPFALLYLVENNTAVLAQCTGIGAGDPLGPAVVPLDHPARERPAREIAGVIERGTQRSIGLDGFVTPLGAAGLHVRDGLVLPVAARAQARPVGALVVGLNPTRQLDDEYRAFFDLVASNIGTAIQNARAAEDEKRRADMLAEMDQAKTVFFSNVSHEFRTPLTLMLAPLEDVITRRTSEISPDSLDLLQLAHRNGLRLQKLVNTLLDFSRLEAGRAQGSFVSTDVATLTADLASNFRSACEAAGLRLVVDCPVVPEAVYVDRIMWEKIVLNLLSNAFKFTFAGEIAVRVRLDRDAIELTVGDTGVGIPAPELPHLFERFHRVHGQRSRTHEGSGIGLALVYELVRLHGGTIAVESALDVGTTMRVRIPRGRAHLDIATIDEAATSAVPTTTVAQFLADIASTIEGVEATLAVAGPARSVPRARVLVADDNRDLREYVSRVLSAEHDVTTARNGVEALDLARRQSFDLLVTDMMMPEMDGFTLLDTLRADERLRTMPVIMLSARAGEESAVEGLARGADDYLVKPFSATELLARVNAQVTAARARAAQLTRDLHANEWFSRPGEETISATSFRAIADQLPFIVWLQNPDAAVSFANEQFFRYTHLPRRPESLDQRMWAACIHPDDLLAMLVTLEEARVAQGPYEIEFRFKPWNGDAQSYRWFHSRALPQVRDGVFQGWLGTATDIHAQREVLQRSRRIAQALQEGFLPVRLPQTPRFRVDAVYQAAEGDALVGGDWFDAVALPSGQLLLSVGDVTGHGIDASSIAGRLHHAIVDFAFVDEDPAAILAATNRVLMTEHPDVYATALVAVVDPACTTLAYASAGHPPPIVASQRERAARELPSGGLPLGVAAPLDLEVHRVPLLAEAVVAFYTDGLIEFNRDIATATDRLGAEIVALVGDTTTEQPATVIRDRVLDGSSTTDDAALLLVQFLPAGVPEPVRRWECDARSASAVCACRIEMMDYIRRFTSDPDALFASELVLGELLANTVEHAPGKVELELDWRAERAVLTIHDDGAGIAALDPRLPHELSEKGRGLFLIATLAEDVQVARRAGRGTTIRATLPVRRAAI